MYEAKITNLNQEPVVWNDSANVLTDPNWIYLGVVPYVLFNAQVSTAGTGLLRYVGSTPEPEGIWTVAPEPAELNDWSLPYPYHVRDTCTYEHGLYRAKVDNQGTPPTQHVSTTEWDFLGYLPDPTTAPANNQVLAWDSSTNDFVFKDPATTGFSFDENINNNPTADRFDQLISLPDAAVYNGVIEVHGYTNQVGNPQWPVFGVRRSDGTNVPVTGMRYAVLNHLNHDSQGGHLEGNDVLATGTTDRYKMTVSNGGSAGESHELVIQFRYLNTFLHIHVKTFWKASNGFHVWDTLDLQIDTNTHDVSGFFISRDGSQLAGNLQVFLRQSRG